MRLGRARLGLGVGLGLGLGWVRLGHFWVRLDFPIVYDFILSENSQYRISLDHVRIPHCVVLFLKKILHCEEFPKIPKSLSQLNTQILFAIYTGTISEFPTM